MTELSAESELRAGLRALELEADPPPHLIGRALAATLTHPSGAGRSVADSALPSAAVNIGPTGVTRTARPRRSWRRAAPALAALMVAAVVVAVLLVRHNGTHPTPPTGSAAPLAVRIELDQTSVRAGTPITGRAIVTNNTSRPLTVADCRGVWLQVGLVSGAISNARPWLDCLSVPATKLPVGTMTIPITVPTTYNGCTSNPSSATANSPACISGAHGPAMMPPLPPGSYSTETEILAPDGVPMPTPNTIDVTLTP